VTASASATSTVAGQAYSEPGAGETAKHSSSGGLSWIWGVVLLVVLGGTGGVVALRRRQG
jgi:hypothetical protein